MTDINTLARGQALGQTTMVTVADQGSLGITITLGQGGANLVKRVAQGSYGERLGLQKGDVIVSINNTATSNKSLDAVVNSLKNTPRPMVLKLKRASAGQANNTVSGQRPRSHPHTHTHRHGTQTQTQTRKCTSQVVLIDCKSVDTFCFSFKTSQARSISIDQRSTINTCLALAKSP